MNPRETMSRRRSRVLDAPQRRQDVRLAHHRPAHLGSVRAWASGVVPGWPLAFPLASALLADAEHALACLPLCPQVYQRPPLPLALSLTEC